MPEHEFDKAYWEQHWSAAADQHLSANPYLAVETEGLRPGSALDAGCGTGAEARWLARQGWQVTGADISSQALTTATALAAADGLGDRIEWVEADLTRWEPGRQWSLVITSYAHPATGQLEFYRRIGAWVEPGGTLLIVGHQHGHQHGGEPEFPQGTTVTPAGITALFTEPGWRVEAAYQRTRTVDPAGRAVRLHDAVVRVVRTTG